MAQDGDLEEGRYLPSLLSSGRPRLLQGDLTDMCQVIAPQYVLVRSSKLAFDMTGARMTPVAPRAVMAQRPARNFCASCHVTVSQAAKKARKFKGSRKIVYLAAPLLASWELYFARKTRTARIFPSVLHPQYFLSCLIKLECHENWAI